MSAVPLPPPPWESPLDLAAHLAATPAGATIKGLFTSALGAEAQRRGLTLRHLRPHHIPFKDYPMTEHMQVLCEAARAFYPAAPLRQGLRVLGRAAFATFHASMLGRVMLGEGDDPGSVLRAIAKGYAVGNSHAQADVLACTTDTAQVRLRDVFHFVDSHHVGVFEGALWACGCKAEVMLRMESLVTGDLFLTWSRRRPPTAAPSR